MKKKIGFISAIVILSLLISFSISASGKVSIDKAKEMYTANKEIFQVSQEVFEQEIEKRDPGIVMFATSIYGHFDGVTLEEIYTLYDEIGNCQDVIDYLVAEDNKRIRSERKARVLSEEEKQAAREEYLALVVSGKGTELLSDSDIENIKATSYKAAIFEYEYAPHMFAFKSVEELKSYMENRLPGEVLFAGSTSKSYGYPLTDIFKLIDDLEHDYLKVLKIVMNDYDNRQN